MCDKLERAPSSYLKEHFWYDSVIYHTPALKSVCDLVGSDKLMYGTDNPFFPPKEGARSDAEWPSTSKNYDAIDGILGEDVRNDIVWGNASRLLGIEPIHQK